MGEPNGTTLNNEAANPDSDASVDNNDQCYVTGNSGGNAGEDDIDNGSVTLTCPPMDLSGYSSASLSFYYWFYNGGGSGTPNDNLQVNLLIDGQPFPILTETVSLSQWRFSGEIPLPAAALQSNNVQVEFVAVDDLPGHVVEAAVDVFNVTLGAIISGTKSPDINAVISVAPNPSNSNFLVQYAWEAAKEMPVLEVRNLLGQVVFTENLSSKSGAISCGNNWIPGVYLAVLRSGSTQGAPVKLVKQ